MKKNSSYNNIAEIYDTITDPQSEISLNFFKKNAKRKKTGKNVLELGCGTGKYTIPMAKEGFNITAIDFSKEMLSIAKQKAKKEKLKIKFVEKDLENFCFDEKFDTVVCFDSLNHLLSINSLKNAFSNAFLSLKNNGIFLFDYMTPKNFENKNFYGGYGGKAGEKYFIWEDFCENNLWQLELTVFEKNGKSYSKKIETIHGTTYPLTTMKKLLKQAGFEKVKIYDSSGKRKPGKKTEFWHFILEKKRKKNLLEKK